MPILEDILETLQETNKLLAATLDDKREILGAVKAATEKKTTAGTRTKKPAEDADDDAPAPKKATTRKAAVDEDDAPAVPSLQDLRDKVSEYHMADDNEDRQDKRGETILGLYEQVVPEDHDGKMNAAAVPEKARKKVIKALQTLIDDGTDIGAAKPKRRTLED